MKKTITTIFLIIASALILSHYAEPLFLKFVHPIRNLYYFGTIEDYTVENGVKKIKYKHLDSDNIVFNPVKYVNVYHNTINKILNDSVYSGYIPVNKNIQLHSKKELLNATNYLITKIDTLTINGKNAYAFPYDFYYNSYGGLDSGWVSGLAQGHACKMFLAAFCISKDSIYLECAEKTINLLDLGIEIGGVKVEIKDGYWYEEYAHKEKMQSPLVLNGHIFAIDALFFLSKVSTKPSYNKLLTAGVNAVEVNIHKYSYKGLWSKYDLWDSFNFANYKYHKIHIDQLNRLINIQNKNKSNIKHFKKLFIFDLIIPIGFTLRLILLRNNMVFVIFFTSLVIITSIYLVIKYLIKKF